MRVVYNGIDFTAEVDRLLAERRASGVRSRSEIHRRKLTPELARQMRRMRARYRWSYRELAEHFEVSKPTAVKVIMGDTWWQPAARRSA